MRDIILAYLGVRVKMGEESRRNRDRVREGIQFRISASVGVCSLFLEWSYWHDANRTDIPASDTWNSNHMIISMTIALNFVID